MPDAPTIELVLKRNSIERLKREKRPFAVVNELPDLIDRGYEDISEEDMVRFQWYGLYHDKPKIGTFMMRVKSPERHPLAHASFAPSASSRCASAGTTVS